MAAYTEPDVDYDPSEICVVFRIDTIPANRDASSHIQRAINTWLLEEAEGFLRGVEATPLERALMPSKTFSDSLARRGVSLTTLRTHTPAVVDIPPVSYGKPLDPTPKALAFYQLGNTRHTFQAQDDGAASWPAITEDMYAIHDLVNLLNLALRKGAIAELKASVVAVTPNWLCSTAHISPGPGSKPEAIDLADLPPSGGWTFQFDNLILDAAVRYSRCIPDDAANVIVAILDTRPELGEIAASKDKNPLIQRLVATFGLDVNDDPLSFPQSRFARLGALSPNQIGSAHARYPLRDHGLFIAGVIHDIAPRAEVHLIRSIGGYGVSALQEVAEALFRVHQAYVTGRSQQKLIINLSLGLTIPPGPDLLAAWFIDALRQRRATEGDPAELRDLEERFTLVLNAIRTRLTPMAGFERQFNDLITSGTTSIAGIDLIELRTYLADVRRSVTEIFAWIEAHPQVLVVAAAGNDHRMGQPPEPRYPASDEHVMGVAAVDRNSPPQPATYTNRGDTGRLDDGVAIWGGNAKLDPAGYELAQIDLATVGGIDAIRGIYSTDEAIGPNLTGWVYWSGTSFATPIIVGIAAGLWAGAPQATAVEIKDAIRGQATVPVANLAVRAIDVRQVPL